MTSAASSSLNIGFFLLYSFFFYEFGLLFLWRLEQESKVFFDINYFGQFVINGEWSKAEKYLSAFADDNDECSAKIFYEMRKHEYLEAKNQ